MPYMDPIPMERPHYPMHGYTFRLFQFVNTPPEMNHPMGINLSREAMIKINNALASGMQVMIVITNDD